MKYDANTIAVIGLGLIGASILKDVERHAPQMRRLGYSKGHEYEIAQREGLIEANTTYKEVVDQADIIIIATPISSVIKVAEEVANLRTSKKRLIVIDVASVKSKISKKFEELNIENPDTTYISTHPMGGSEKGGYEGSKRGLFRNKPWLICADQTEIESDTKDLVRLIEDACGARIYYFPPEKHDEIIAVSSHFILDLSNVLFEFVSKQYPGALKTAGESFITTTRLASDNPVMLSEINEFNHAQIEKITKSFISFLAERIEGDGQLDLEYFKKNKLSRDSWLHHRNKNDK